MNVLLALTAVLLVGGGGGVSALTCFSCASSLLNTDLWIMTGFKAPASTDGFFTDSCKKTTGADGNVITSIKQVECSSACVTLRMTNPKAVAGDKLFLRGCHSELTGFVASELTTVNDKCERDPAFKTTDPDGKAIEVDATIFYCSKQDGSKPCNSHVDADVESNCQTTVTGKVKECYECYGEKNCFENKIACDKKYCYKSEIDLGDGFRRTHKTCTSFNPLGLVSRCIANSNNLFVPVRTNFPMTVYQCFCKDEELCNGAATVFGAAGTLASLVSVVLAYMLQ